MAGTYLALLGTALGLQGAGAALHALGEAEVAVVGAVVEVGQPRQGQDVVTGDPQDGQLGQLLPIRVTRHLGGEKASGGAAGLSAENGPGQTGVWPERGQPGWGGKVAGLIPSRTVIPSSKHLLVPLTAPGRPAHVHVVGKEMEAHEAQLLPGWQ